MRYLLIILVAFAIGCQREKSDTIPTTQEPVITVDTTKIMAPPTTLEPRNVHSNERFKNVSVKKLEGNKFLIAGEGQLFEANFGWTVEDGHNELAKGFEMTDAGAPSWGKFDFTIEVEKARENSTRTLILFESSAKDGSRQHELLISLH